MLLLIFCCCSVVAGNIFLLLVLLLEYLFASFCLFLFHKIAHFVFKFSTICVKLVCIYSHLNKRDTNESSAVL